MTELTQQDLNRLSEPLYKALKPHLEDAEATEKAIAEFAQKHGIPQEEVRRMADEQTEEL